MHSSGWIYSIVASANSASSLRGWMQSTGQTSTQAVSLVSIQGSVMMKGMLANLRRVRENRARYAGSGSTGPVNRGIIPCVHGNAKNIIGLVVTSYPIEA